MEKKFTPGEWHAVEYGNFWNIQSTPHYDDCINILDGEDCKEAEQNAILASYSKKLLIALSALVDMKNYKDEKGKDELYLIGQPLAWENAKEVLAAIAKATQL